MTRCDCLPISSIPGMLLAAFSPLMREILLLMIQHVCLNPITLTRFEKDLAYTYDDPKEISDNLSSSLGLRCLTHCVVLVLCVPGIKQCIIWILLLPVSVCFERAT